jgi:hypothetical protein
MIDSDKITVRPYSHGVVHAVMSVAANESRVFTLRLASRADGVVPPGAEVALNGHTYPVGTQGIAQLPVAHAAVDASVSWQGGRCHVHLPSAAVASAAARRSSDAPLGVDCKRP